MSMCVRSLLAATFLLWTSGARAAPIEFSGGGGKLLTVVVRETSIQEVFEMLSRRERVNILISNGIKGNVSVNLYDVTLHQAIRQIAESAGYVAERRHGSYMILQRDQAGKDSAHGNTVVRALKVYYSDPVKVSEILSKHLSRYGEITVFEDRRLIVLEDLPDFVQRALQLLEEIDREPAQILIEAKILEITLTEDETFGIDWTLFLGDGETGELGVQGFVTPGALGFFLDYVKEDNLEVALSALEEQGRVRTLSTPTLLTVENQESEVVIGDRLGFRVTTTINQVTSESVEFLESGVILKFKASVDRLGRVLLEVHPEVSTGVINDGLPSQTTAEVTTTFLAEDGQTILIGGLIKDRVTENHAGIPILKNIPYLGWLFSKRTQIVVMTETVIVVTAHVLKEHRERVAERKTRTLGQAEIMLRELRHEMEDRHIRPPHPAAANEADAGAESPSVAP